jgi:predicted MPP superfamily phosphohydrolase
MQSDGFQPQLTWLHVSDIHTGVGDPRDAEELRQVLRALRLDAAELAEDGIVQPSSLVLMTGDLTQTGGVRNAEEFGELDRFVDALRNSINPNMAVFAVPGNHDCARLNRDADRDMSRLVDQLRQGSMTIDDALADKTDSTRLRARFEAYDEWQRRSCVPDTASENLVWTHTIPLQTAQVTFRGVNTAWLSQDDSDVEKLQVPLAHLLVSDDPGDTIRVLAMHHPFSWLRDGPGASASAAHEYNIVLSGHMHHAHHETRRVPGTSATTWVQAGATYSLSDRKWVRDGGHTYNVCSIGFASDGGLVFRVYPRVFRGGVRFVPDTALTEPNKLYSEDPLPQPGATPRLAGSLSTGPSTSNSPDGELPQHCRELLRQFGRRRTAFPTDLSLDELADGGLTIDARFIREGQGVDSLGASDIVDVLTSGQNVLLLGSPGSGKSVAIHETARVALSAGLSPLVYRFSDVRRLFSSGEELQALKRLVGNRRRGGKHVILVDGLDEASGTDTGGGRTVGRWLSELSALGPLLVSCRAADYKLHLSAYVEPVGFDALVTLQPWRVQVEFRTFVARLVEQRLVPNDDLIDVVQKSETLARLVRVPLFARMLTLIGPTGAGDVRSEDDLYKSFFAGLSTRTATELGIAGCEIEDPLVVWREAAWSVFSLNLLQDEAVNLRALIKLLSVTGDAQDRCMRRALAVVIDRGSDVLADRAAFLHYSFFEYLLADAIAERLGGETSATDETLTTLAIDIPRRVRHFLVGRLRAEAPDKVKAVLQQTYRRLRDEHALALSRSGCNLIAYLLSRSFDSGAELRDLYGTETDMFLQNSLRWALTHSGDMAVAEEFVDELDRSAHYAAMCRGYLLYYHGDLTRESTPPFFDLDATVSWTRTRAAVHEIMSNTDYGETVAEARRVIDLYTFLSFALLRNQTVTVDESRAVHAVLDELWSGASPGRILHRLQAMVAVVCEETADL